LKITTQGSKDGTQIISKDIVFPVTSNPGNITFNLSGLPVGDYHLYGTFMNSTTGAYLYALGSRDFVVTEYIPSYLGTDLAPDDYSSPPVFNSDTYYDSVSSYDTPTAFYTGIASLFDPIAS